MNSHARRTFICVIAGELLAAPLAANGQRTKRVARIGFLVSRFHRNSRLIEAFHQGLRAHGYVEGDNVAIVIKDVEGNDELYPRFAAELVALKPDVIVAPATPAARAAMQATKTIPILFLGDPDPVASGFVASLARPAGNVTGLSNIGTELFGKRLELLKQAAPGVRQVAYLWYPGVFPASTERDMLKRAEADARALALRLQFVEVRAPGDFDRAFAAMHDSRSDALVLHNPGPMLFGERKRIGELAATHRLPAVFPVRDFVDAGGLLSYGADFASVFRRAATFVDKLLKGTRPGDLPVEQATKFELVINLNAAKSLGLTIPPALLERADDVVR